MQLQAVRMTSPHATGRGVGRRELVLLRQQVADLK
jgi:hypothetical protein